MGKKVKEALGRLLLSDWLIWITTLSLAVLSVILLAGILQSDHARLLRLSQRNITSQIGALCAGTVSALILSMIDYRILTAAWKIYVPASYLLLLSTFVIGVSTQERSEAKRWLSIPIINMSIQPSEFLKLAFILSFAYHVYSIQNEINRPRNIMLMCIHGAIPVLLVQYQGDSGSAMLLGLIFLSMIFASGLQWKFILITVAALAGSIPILWNFVLGDFQKQRILVLLNPSSIDKLGYFYQQDQSMTAIASGRLWGNGIFSSANPYVPAMHNDFIFSFIASSLGFLGSMAVVMTIGLLCLKILFNAVISIDKRGQLICVGIFAMIFFQAGVNIGMCLAVLPVVGNPLPFLSSGGSSLLANFMGIGLAMSVCIRTREKKKFEGDYRSQQQKAGKQQ